MGLKEFFEGRIRKVAGVSKVNNGVLTKLERETEYATKPLSQDMKSGGYLCGFLEFRSLEELECERKEVQLLFKKYR